MLGAALWAIFAASSLLFGAFAAVKFAPTRRRVGLVMGFGGGALVAALAYELIPDPDQATWQVWACFGAGALIFYVADGALERRSGGDEGDDDGDDEGGAGIAIALGALLDGVPESMVLGIGIAVGGSVSVGFLVAVFVSNVPESLSSTSALRANHSTAWVYGLWGSIMLASGVAAAIGYAAAHGASSLDGRYIQAVAAGGVLTMLSSSMMPEALAEGGRASALATAIGFAVAAFLTTFG
jgi:ZIP family zinc transporter